MMLKNWRTLYCLSRKLNSVRIISAGCSSTGKDGCSIGKVSIPESCGKPRPTRQEEYFDRKFSELFEQLKENKTNHVEEMKETISSLIASILSGKDKNKILHDFPQGFGIHFSMKIIPRESSIEGDICSNDEKQKKNTYENRDSIKYSPYSSKNLKEESYFYNKQIEDSENLKQTCNLTKKE